METCLRGAQDSARAKRVMTCPRCDEAIHMARRSEYVDPWRVQLEWECDACGHHFGTLAWPARG
jgi:ribosomal protein L37AE/L43A